MWCAQPSGSAGYGCGLAGGLAGGRTGFWRACRVSRGSWMRVSPAIARALVRRNGIPSRLPGFFAAGGLAQVQKFSGSLLWVVISFPCGVMPLSIERAEPLESWIAKPASAALSNGGVRGAAGFAACELSRPEDGLADTSFRSSRRRRRLLHALPQAAN